MKIGMPGCAAMRLGGALGIVVALGCGSNTADDTIPDSGGDGSLDSSIHDSSVADSGKDANVVPDSGADADTDAGTDADTDAGTDSGPDSGVVCGAKLGMGYVSLDGGCGTGEDYTCGTDMYEIMCECPAATCTCTKNSKPAGSVAFAGCPGCKAPSFSAVASGCGIPF